MRTLRVCLSKDFPLLTDRDPNFIYFLYDKLFVFLGQNQYNDPYAIVDNIPEHPVSGILYFILKDGSVRSYIEYKLTTIATIENQEQLELLKQSGATFFVSANKRQLDVQRRIITLPFLNGTYELSVDLMKDILIDENTIIRYDPKFRCFVIDNNEISDTYFHSGGYRGSETDSVKTTISDMRISSEVKISKADDNILKQNDDGLYANAEDRVLSQVFDDWATRYKEYKTNMEYYLKSLDEEIGGISDLVSPESIAQKIHDAVEEVYPEIDDIVAKYDDLYKQITDMESGLYDYAQSKYDAIVEELRLLIQDASDNAWISFEDEIKEHEGA